MTPEDHELDSGLLLEQKPLVLYRIAKARYANLSGIGRAIAPGRWNQRGEEAIYASTNPSMPILERLVHVTDKSLIPSNLAQMTIHLSGEWETDRDSFADQKTGAFFEVYKSLKIGRSKFHRKGPPGSPSLWKRFALAVPSVIHPVWNVVLFPKGTSFWKHVLLKSVEKFEFDPRLFNEGAAFERSESRKQRET